MAYKVITDVSLLLVCSCHGALTLSGRRALKTYMSLFLFDILAQATRSQASSADLTYLQNILATPHSVDQLVATHRLGDHVGRAMGLEKVMRWHPTVRLDGASGQQESGLFKVRGACVEAVLGAIYHYRVCSKPLLDTDNKRGRKWHSNFSWHGFCRI